MTVRQNITSVGIGFITSVGIGGLVLALVESTGVAAEPGQTILLEAEGFDDYGGWVDDSQFMDQMGSPFLLAHGLGRPVADATTAVEFPAAGEYRVWVRTRDWVAPWKAPGTPGRFQLVVDGKPLPVTFGTEGAQWHWHDGGTVEIARGRAKVALHDLTGFEGRCDAIVFSAEEDFTPPNEGPALAAFRRKLLGISDEPGEAGQFDLVVVGGGIAGTCAALAAARLDLQVALVQDRPVLGGNNSSEVRVWLQGKRNVPPYPRVGDVVRELEQQKAAHYGPTNTADLYEDDKKLAVVRAQQNLRLFLCHRVNQAETADGRIRAVIAQHTKTARRVRFAGRWFADCTGDGAVGFLAGADHDITLTGHMGRCNLWNVIETNQLQPFPRCPWALDLADKPFPGRGDERPGILSLGGWYWESGFDHDPIAHGELIRDWNFRAMYGAWDALKNVDRVYPNHKLNWAAHISGKRESRRLLGDVVLSKEDLLAGRKFPDGCVPTGWKIDLHLPDARYEAGFQGDAFLAKAHFTDYPRPFWIPYRCLYSRNIANLFMAGRDVSVTHEALGTARVMRTGGCMGEIVGMAASLCKRYDADPRHVYQNYLDELQALMTRGVGKLPQVASPQPPKWLEDARENLARTAKVIVSSSRDAKQYPPANINDGRVDFSDNNGRWLSGDEPPHTVEFVWAKPQSIGAVRVLSGFCEGNGQLVGAVEGFELHARDGTEWKPVPSVKAAGNTRVDWHARFPAVTTDALRLTITATPGGIARVWEVEFYDLP